jgi:hypothetical protein
MSESSKYICSHCGKEHDDWPALAYSSPTNYDELSGEEKQNWGALDSDFCIISYPDQTDRFIRCTMTQKVLDHCEDLEYGLWVSLSETSFQDYSDNFNQENHETTYFGWLANVLPDYDFSVSIPTTVFTRKGNERPEIVPHETTSAEQPQYQAECTLARWLQPRTGYPRQLCRQTQAEYISPRWGNRHGQRTSHLPPRIRSTIIEPQKHPCLRQNSLRCCSVKNFVLNACFPNVIPKPPALLVNIPANTDLCILTRSVPPEIRT